MRADDPVEAALVLADERGADLVDGADHIAEALARVRSAVAERDEARSVLALLPDPAPLGPLRVVSDLVALRALVSDIDRARTVLYTATAAARRSAGSVLGVRRRADGLEAAARELRLARADAEAHRLELARQEAEWSDGQPGQSESSRRGGAHLVDEDDDLVGGRRPRALDRFADVVGRRSGRDGDGDDLASDALAHVSALTDRAYGGVGSGGHVPEAIAALRADVAPAERLRLAEATWTVLAGSADPDDGRPEVPEAELPDEVEGAAPAVRAAAADLRRLEARWKVAWWALGRPVPPHDNAEEALDQLESEGTVEITVEGWSAQAASASVDRTRFEAAAEGRSEEQLRAVADRTLRPVVVLDEPGAVDVEAFEAEVASLPDDAGVTLVVPTVTSA